MSSPPLDTEPAVTSELIDLGTVSLTMLRTRDDAALRRALRRAVEGTGRLRVNDVDKDSILIG
jgi:FXSXX-COOH protein